MYTIIETMQGERKILLKKPAQSFIALFDNIIV